MSPAEFRRRVAMNIQAARRRAGMTQDQVGATGVVHKRYYQEVERGLANPTVDVLFALARLFDIPPAALFDVDGPPDIVEQFDRRIRKKRNWDASAAAQRRVAPVIEDRKRRKKARRQKRARRPRS